jgi:hypothetical protein
MISMFMQSLFLLGYVFLVGPPRAVEISAQANAVGDELQGKPIWVVILIEFIFRSGIFLVIAASFESFLGDLLYEQYRLDLFLGSLILAGLIHTFSYYVSYCVLHFPGHSLSRVYRLGRNFAYAIVPAFFAAGLVLIWQDINEIELFSGDYFEQVFFGTWSFFVLMGLAEALLMKRIPTGLGQVLFKRLKKV